MSRDNIAGKGLNGRVVLRADRAVAAVVDHGVRVSRGNGSDSLVEESEHLLTEFHQKDV